MRKFIALGLTMMFALNVAATAQERFAKYRRIDAYEVRPDILMIPRYTSANEVCEIGLERLNYSPTHIRLNADLSREEISQTLDELVPANERGKPSPSKVGDDLIEQFGQTPTETKTTEYENVQISIYAIPFPYETKKGSKKEVTMNPIVATITWKYRKCK